LAVSRPRDGKRLVKVGAGWQPAGTECFYEAVGCERKTGIQQIAQKISGTCIGYKVFSLGMLE
jgi:hypothetical protein